MKGIIYYASGHRELAINKIKDLIERYKSIKIEPRAYSLNKNSCYVEFVNGDVWTIKRACDSARGYRCNVAYIDRAIPYQDFQLFIRHYLSIPPFTAFQFYGEGDLHITDEVPLPF